MHREFRRDVDRNPLQKTCALTRAKSIVTSLIPGSSPIDGRATPPSEISSAWPDSSPSYASVGTQSQRSQQPFCNLNRTEADQTALNHVRQANSIMLQADMKGQVPAVLTPAQQRTPSSDLKAGGGHHHHYNMRPGVPAHHRAPQEQWILHRRRPTKRRRPMRGPSTSATGSSRPTTHAVALNRSSKKPRPDTPWTIP